MVKRITAKDAAKALTFAKRYGPELEYGVIPSYGRGFARMKERLGPDRAEELRQEVLRDQLAAREKWGGQPVNERDRDTYQNYPKSKRSKRRKK